MEGVADYSRVFLDSCHRQDLSILPPACAWSDSAFVHHVRMWALYDSGGIQTMAPAPVFSKG